MKLREYLDSSVTERVERELAVEREKIYQLEKSKDELISKLEWSLGEHKQWLGDARSRISQLEGEISGQAAEFERTRLDLQAAIDRLHEKNCHLKHELHEVTTENERLKGELEKLKAEFSEGHPELKEQIEELKGQLAAKEHEARISGLEAELNALRTQGEEMTMRLQHSDEAAFRPEIDNLKAQILEKENELQRLRPVEETKNNEIGALRGENDWLKGELSAKDGHINDLNKLKNDAEWSLGEHRQWLSNANNRLSELENSINEKNTLIDSMHQEIQRLQKLIAEMPEQKDTAEETQQSTFQLRERIVELESKLHEVEKSLSEAPNVDELKINDLTNCLSDKERQIESMQKEIDELRIVKLQEGERLGQEELQQLHDRISDLEQQLSNVPKPDEIKISGLEAELHSKSEALNALQAQRDTSVGEDPMIARLESNVAELREELRQVTEEKIEKERENEGINKMVQGLLEDLNDKNRQLDELNKLKNDTEWKLGEHRQWLSDANNRIGELERALESKNDEADRLLGESRETIANLQQQTNDLSGQIEQLKRDKEVLEQKLETPIEKQAVQMAAAVPTEPHDGMDGDQLQAELLKKEELLDRMNREASNKDEEIKIGQLTSEVNEKSRIIDILHHQLEELKKALDATGDAKKLMDEIKEKNRIIDDLNKLKNDTEWSLGEHKQWLNDANNRANGFENACKDKDAIIDALRKEMEELKTASSEIPHGALLSEGEDLAKLHENIQNLEEKLRDAERAIAEAPKGDEIKASSLENAMKEKDAMIERLHKEIDDLKKVCCAQNLEEEM
ncbi:unnamed protein product [Toxocara canis]|uniref:GRIP domain-containing protein n=1 Tax=Toxocara canis TaxID=6265 RepID=A0A183V7D7_TOXCA|nr:unnamed protein product [Toxocara canis]